jgi:copper chaperone
MAKEIVNLSVEGMSCSHCENSVKKAVGALKGVSTVTVDLKAKRVLVELESGEVSLEKIKNAIEDEGYDVVG